MLLRYQKHGRTRYMGLGSFPEVPLAQAREEARAARLLLRAGIDPIEHRRAERAKQAQMMARALPFRAAAQRYFEANSAGWSNLRHAAQFNSTLAQHVHPVIGNIDVAAIDTPDILRVLERHVDAERGWPAGRFWDVARGPPTACAGGSLGCWTGRWCAGIARLACQIRRAGADTWIKCCRRRATWPRPIRTARLPHARVPELMAGLPTIGASPPVR